MLASNIHIMPLCGCNLADLRKVTEKYKAFQSSDLQFYKELQSLGMRDGIAFSYVSLMRSTQ